MIPLDSFIDKPMHLRTTDSAVTPVERCTRRVWSAKEVQYSTKGHSERVEETRQGEGDIRLWVIREGDIDGYFRPRPRGHLGWSWTSCTALCRTQRRSHWLVFSDTKSSGGCTWREDSRAASRCGDHWNLEECSGSPWYARVAEGLAETGIRVCMVGRCNRQCQTACTSVIEQCKEERRVWRHYQCNPRPSQWTLRSRKGSCDEEQLLLNHEAFRGTNRDTSSRSSFVSPLP